MKPRTFLLAVVAAALCMFVVAGLWHNLVLPGLYADKEAHHNGLGLMLVAYFVLAALMTYLYARTSSGRRPAWDGALFGVVVGVLWVFPHELVLAGAHGDSLAYVFKNGAWHVVEQGLGGWVLGLVLGRHALH
jgi:hypothetical protein